ncbi:GTP cyclohydrolase 1 type 2/Nif3 [Kalaharituber pfeilii]|nr:GTP cyclohydrolase 1 type 2/Nif3 [Kalaharituber pfeilii]
MSTIIRTVANSVRRLYPEALADKSWDNTGLLLEAPYRSDIKRLLNRHIVLLTIDLTKAVAAEAIEMRAAAIVSYHPIIFRPLKSLTFADTQQDSIIRLAQAGISVYSPHTAVDATPGGVNDWLTDGISGGKENEISREVLIPVEVVEGFASAGMGRMVTLKEPSSLGSLVERVKAYLGMKHLMVAEAARHKNTTSIRRIGVCAGSGGSMFKGLDADLYFTGELSHHEALTAKERGVSVISCFHTNTERGYLNKGMKPKLQEVLAAEWAHVADAEREGAEGFEVVVSKADKDPYEIV